MNKYVASLNGTKCCLELRCGLHPQKNHTILINPTLTFETDTETRKPAHLILVLDTSSSMRGEPIQQLKEACGALIEKLFTDDQLTIIKFDEKASRLYHSKVYDKIQALQILSQINTDHGTSVGHGMQCALDSIEQTNIRRTTVVLVSDGQDTIRNENRILPSAIIANCRERFNDEVPMIVALGLGPFYEEQTFLQYAREGGATYVHLDGNSAFKPQVANVIPLLAGNQSVALTYHCTLGNKRGKKDFGNVGFHDPRGFLIEAPRQSEGNVTLQLSYSMTGADQEQHVVSFDLTLNPAEITRLDYDVVAQYVASQFVKHNREIILASLKLLAYAELLKLLPSNDQSPVYAPAIRTLLEEAIASINASQGSVENVHARRTMASMDLTLLSGGYSSDFFLTSTNLRRSRSEISDDVFDPNTLTFKIDNVPHRLITSNTNFVEIPENTFLLPRYDQEQLSEAMVVKLSTIDPIIFFHVNDLLAAVQQYVTGTIPETHPPTYVVRQNAITLVGSNSDDRLHFRIDFATLIQEHKYLLTYIDMALLIAIQLGQAVKTGRLAPGQVSLCYAYSDELKSHPFCVYETSDDLYILDSILDRSYNLKDAKDRGLIQIVYMNVDLNGLLRDLFHKRGYKHDPILQIHPGFVNNLPSECEDTCRNADLYCGIKQGVPSNPVRGNDGKIYDRFFITAWLTRNPFNPWTRLPMTVNDLTDDPTSVRRILRIMKKYADQIKRLSAENRTLENAELIEARVSHLALSMLLEEAQPITHHVTGVYRPLRSAVVNRSTTFRSLESSGNGAAETPEDKFGAGLELSHFSRF